MEINYIIGNKNEDALGIKRITEGFQKSLKKEVKLNVIDYLLPTSFEKPIIKQAVKFGYFPLKTIYKIKKNIPTHITSQGYAYLLNFIPNQKTVVTCCDLVPLLFPEEERVYQPIINWIFKSLKKAKLIISISNHTKNDLIKLLNIPDQKIKVIYPGIDNIFFKDSNAWTSPPLPEYFILYVGSYDKRKNIPLIIDLFRKLKKNNKKLKLIIVNKEENFPCALTKTEKNEVIFTGFITNKNLCHLYQKAQFLVFPSEYEGFGFPPLEAMAVGCPVITSNTTSLPEIVGDAGFQVSLNKQNEWLAKSQVLLTNNNIRNTIIERGKKQARNFNWQKSIDKILSLYEELEING